MPRPLRILRSAAATLSAALCMIALLLWGLSRVSEWDVRWVPTGEGRIVTAWSGSGRLALEWGEYFRDPSLDRLRGRIEWAVQPWTPAYPQFGSPPEMIRPRPVLGFAAGRYGAIRVAVRDGRGDKRPWYGAATEFVVLPYAAVVAATAILPVWTWRPRPWTWTWGQRSRRTGHCPTCGYDLRATPERCPECGAVPVRANGNAEAQRR